MVALAVFAIGVSIGVPAYKNLITDNRMTATVNEFTADLQFSRTEAITRGLEVRICASGCDAMDVQSCTCAGAGPWDRGWIVLVVNNDEVLRVHRALKGEDRLEGGGNVAYMLTFDGNGFARGANDEIPSDNGAAPRIQLCDVDKLDRHARAVEVFFTGQVDLKNYFRDGITCT